MKESDSSVRAELPIVNAAVEKMKVILERNEEISGASFWRQKRGDAFYLSNNAREAILSASLDICRVLRESD